MAELSAYLIFVAFSIVLGSFQCGYHMGEMNIPQRIISCEPIPSDDSSTSINDYTLPSCIPMTQTQYSLVTSIFNLGGLLGSLMASRIADNKGRRWALLVNCVFFAVGPTVMGFAKNYGELIFGRVLVGIGSGVVLVVVPMYLIEISPINYRGVFGVTNQLGLVLGILFSQIQGLYLSSVPGWRVIFLSATAISIIQFVFLQFAVESPRYLLSKPAGYNSAKKTLQLLRGDLDVNEEIQRWKQVDTEEETGNLIPVNKGEEDEEIDVIADVNNHHTISSQQNDNSGEISASLNENAPQVVFHAHNPNENFNIYKFITSVHYRPALYVVLLLLITQQFSGINAVIFYSTEILAKIFPTSSRAITVFISIVNTIMTLVSAALIEKSGRRKLLLYSISSMSLSSTVLALSINHNWGFLAAFSIIAFVASFAVGLGPIPFLIIPEIVDTTAAATASSLGLSLNWMANFFVGFTFLIVREILGGSVFFIFTIYLLFAFYLTRLLVPETKGKTVEEVWFGWIERM
ncbi:3496_t:CDS:2 [Entrophospora sp. SA101]|nr:3496_t:CDS:2 [Entrophospora sp. SA101]